jgi:hypothetical protein
MTDNGRFEHWAILELMGHRRLAGHVTEQEIAGAAMLRIDIPSDPPATPWYSPQAVYAITPTTEDLCRRFAQQHQPAPVSVWELPKPREETIDAHGIRHDPDDEDVPF